MKTMTLGEKLAYLRTSSSYSLEELSQKLVVPVSQLQLWEADQAVPDTETLISISSIYGCTTDFLLHPEDVYPYGQGRRMTYSVPLGSSGNVRLYTRGITPRPDIISKTKIGSLPLYYIGRNPKNCAKGVFAVGIRAKGIFSIGIFSMGVVSIGCFSCGLLFSLGIFSLAALLAVGNLALGSVAIGLITISLFFSMGVMSFSLVKALGLLSGSLLSLQARFPFFMPF